MQVVVTGASGFIGAAVVRHLRSRDVSVHALARSATALTTVVADYAQAPPADALIHLAEARDRGHVRDAGPAYERDIARTLERLLDKAYARVVYGSSGVLYGDAATLPRQPHDPVTVSEPYARVKQSSEAAVLRGGGVVARLANVFGPGMASSNVLGTILEQIPGTGPVRVLDASPVRDFLWIDDAAAGLAQMALGGPSGIFNLGSGIGTSIHDLARLALDVAGEPQRSVVSTAPSGRASSLVLDIDLTRARFAWHPATTLRDGLSALLALKRQGKTWANGR
jgi:UDP-glucose 4-epimerase